MATLGPDKPCLVTQAQPLPVGLDSALAQTALGQSVHRQILGRLCQGVWWWGEAGEVAPTRESAGPSWALPPAHSMKVSEADLTPGSGVGPWSGRHRF